MATVEEVEAQKEALRKAQEAKLLAEAAKANAEAERAVAESNNFEELTRQAALMTQGAQININQIKRAEAELLAGDKYNMVYQFNDSVGSTSVGNCIKQLTTWSRTHAGKPIEIIFNSPGGSVIDGMALFDFILSLRNAGHDITTVAYGYAASMAGILLQAGTRREMGKEAYILIHEISTAVGGKIGEIEDEVEFVKKIQKRVVSIFVDRSGGKLTRAKIMHNWKRKDWWLDSEEALSLGVVDSVR